MAGPIPSSGPHHGELTIMGHHVPWQAIAALAAVAGVILLMRARQSGSAASVGAVPLDSAASTGFGTMPDYSGALANISQQLTTLSQQPPVGGTTPPATTPPPGITTVATANPPFLPVISAPGLKVPIAATAGGPPIAWLNQGSQVSLAGAPVQARWGSLSFLAEPINYLGGHYFINTDNLPV